MQLGILTFLRRSHKTFPPITAQVTVPPDVTASPTAVPEQPQAPPLMPAAESLPQLPQAFRSERYGYTLRLPAGWCAVEPRSIAGSPPIDRFAAADGTSLGVWNEPCPWRSLPDVPPEQRVGAFPLADGALVQFVAFAPSKEDGTQLLEGRWLAKGKRWTADVQVTVSAERVSMPEVLRRLLASLCIEG